MAELNVRFDIRLTQNTFRWLIALLVTALSVTDVGSESVTLNTYYPAPSGVYKYMIVTADTYLARDSGKVAVGMAAAAPDAELAVKSSAAGTAGLVVHGA